MPKLPAEFLNSLSRLDNLNVKAFEAVHEEEDRLTSIRLNPFKTPRLDFTIGEAVPWHPLGYYLNERPYFTHDPLFHAGCYYVQEPGSMFLAHALGQSIDFSKDISVLDACAAPGGKSTLINSLLSPGSLLVANEPVKSRADILAQNLGRWGTANCVVTNNFPEKFSELKGFFDVLVIDAPCSGSGLFRKQPEAIAEWSADAVQVCSARQKNILETLVPTLKENGILFYSTCSYSIEENEDVIKWLIDEMGLLYQPLPVDPSWGIVETPLGYRFYPHLAKSEGFFCAVLKKVSDSATKQRHVKQLPGPGKDEAAVIAPFVELKNSMCLKINGRIHLVNEAVQKFVALAAGHFYLKKAGTLVGEVKNGKLVPEQELAWSINLGTSVEKIDLDKAAAVNYLKKENFSVEKTSEQGLRLMTYTGWGLGWVKVLPNRINNYFPNELRIIK